LKRTFTILTLALIFLVSGFTAQSQSDTAKTEKKLNKKAIYGNARKATVMSAIIPGLGQVYNRKWWKAPIIYAGLGGFGYLLYYNQGQYAYYAKNLKYENDDDPSTINETNYSSDQLLSEKTRYRKYRDMGFIGCAIIYALNIVDANVDAHLKTFDVSDDLSLRIRPYTNVYCTNNSFGIQNGLSLSLNFKSRSHRSHKLTRIYL